MDVTEIIQEIQIRSWECKSGGTINCEIIHTNPYDIIRTSLSFCYGRKEANITIDTPCDDEKSREFVSRFESHGDNLYVEHGKYIDRENPEIVLTKSRGYGIEIPCLDISLQSVFDQFPFAKRFRAYISDSSLFIDYQPIDLKFVS